MYIAARTPDINCARIASRPNNVIDLRRFLPWDFLSPSVFVSMQLSALP